MLSELGKYCKNADFQKQVSEFFWKIISESDQYNDEVIQNCITKFSEMIKYWSLAQKKPFFDRLAVQVQNTENSSLPLLRLFMKLIKDQKERVVY